MPMSLLKRVLAIVFVLALSYTAYQQSPDNPPRQSVEYPSSTALDDAIDGRRNDYQVQGSGVIERLLSDDNDGSRHQRFIVRLDSGRTVLVAHNIDLAPRVPNLQKGQQVSFFGEYEWNERGGVIHWTHHDPRGQHVGGWIDYKGRRYQ